MFHRSIIPVGLLLGLVLPLGAADAPATGFQPEVRVAAPTRLDWQFAAAGFGTKAAQLPASYESDKQRYQLYVPAGYDRAKAWPLVVFVSPGDDPLGWRVWQKPCEQSGSLFCAAYGAGNNCPPGQRIRIVLDVLDDVRRHYHVDPDQTYVSGFSGGGRIACTLAFTLPEFFGGVVPICGTNPLGKLDYLRHRIQDRLSVAFVTGADDFNRRENEEYMFPFCRALEVRTRLWVVPKLGHGLPPPAVLAETYAWLAEDLKRRQADARAHPGLTVRANEVPTPLQQALRQIETAEAEWKDPERTWRGAALLLGVVSRWGKTAAGDRARKLLQEIKADPKRLALLEKQGGREERRMLTAQAQALERYGDSARALQAWRLLLENHPDTPEGKTAAVGVRRLTTAPYLGVGFKGETATIEQVAPGSPAAQAGLQPGDAIVRLAGTRVASLPDVRRVLQLQQVGDKVMVAVQRNGKPLELTVELGVLPPAEGKP